MKYRFMMLLLPFMFSCSDDLSSYKGYEVDFRDKIYSDIKHVGSSCDVNCIYSNYAVKYNIQSKQYDCIEGPCACVEEGNANNLCADSSNPQDLWAQEDIDLSQETIKVGVIPYYNQYDNINYPSSTCQNTSIAMVLSKFQYKIQPDDIFSRWGKDLAQSPSGLNYVYKHYATNSSINTYTNATPEDLTNALDNGYIVIVHGYFTSFGHVLIIKGYDDSYYYVNDPAGVWDGCFKCGYSQSYNGVTQYPRQSLENAVFTSDGYSYLPGWIHLIKGN